VRRVALLGALLCSMAASGQLFPVPGPGSKPAAAGATFPVGVTALVTTFTDGTPPTDTGGTSLDGSGNIASVVKDWGGAVWRSRTSALVLPANGGHAGYGGNQVYQYTITDATTQALTRNSPTIPSELKCTNDLAAFCTTGLPPTGAPGSCSGAGTTAPNADHTYATLGYDPGTSSADDYVLKAGSNFPRCSTPAGDDHFWTYTFSTDTWVNLGSPTYAGGAAGPSGCGGTGSCAAKAIVRKDSNHWYWWAANTTQLNFVEYGGPGTNTVTRKADDVAANSMVASIGDYDPVHDSVVHIMYYGSNRVVKVALSGFSVSDTALDASCPAVGASLMGFSYDPGTAKFIIFPNSSVNSNTGNLFYLMDPVALTCTSTTLPGSAIGTANHSAGNSNGTFGRLRCNVTIAGQSNLCVLLNDYGQVVDVLRFI
jgi:hypothetical protein